MKGYKDIIVRTSAALAILAGMTAQQTSAQRIITSPISPRDIAGTVANSNPPVGALTTAIQVPYGTPTTAGLKDVGLGEAINLEVQVPRGPEKMKYDSVANALVSDTDASGTRQYNWPVVTSVTWSLDKAPVQGNGNATNPYAPGTSALSTASPTSGDFGFQPAVMPATMPIFEVVDRTSYMVGAGSRKIFVPDVRGLYTLSATVVYTVTNTNPVLVKDANGVVTGYAANTIVTTSTVGPASTSTSTVTNGGTPVVKTTTAENTNMKIVVSAGMYAGVGTIPTITATTSGTPAVTTYTTTWSAVDKNGPLTAACGTCHTGPTDNKTAQWQGTLHATKLIRELSDYVSPGTSHYSGSCVKCHSVGYNTALKKDVNSAWQVPNLGNGGFSELIPSTIAPNAWTWLTAKNYYNFPGASAPGVTPVVYGLAPSLWNNLTPAMKAVGNIQCENCHGAGSEHGLTTDPRRVSVSYNVGVCASCHDSGSTHVKVAEWRQALHSTSVNRADSTTSTSATSVYAPGSMTNCGRCHSVSGFSNFATPRDAGQRTFGANGSEVVSCTACHDPHNDKNDHQIRTTDDIVLANGDVIKDGEDGKLCMQCHISRRDAKVFVESLLVGVDPATGKIVYDLATPPAPKTNLPSTGSAMAPQADMLAGLNGYEFGQYVPASNGHILATEDACVTCHMQTMPATVNGVANPVFISDATSPNKGVSRAGQHTFKMSWMNGTTEVDETGVCKPCHSGMVENEFDVKTLKDYDGNGVAEGVQTEIRNLLTTLADMLPQSAPGVVASATTTSTMAQRGAIFNWGFVNADGSYGVHNPMYAAGLLKTSIAALGGSAGMGQLGGVDIGSGWFQSAWFGCYSPMFDGNWVFHQYHGPLYINPDQALDGYTEMWDPVLKVWMRTTAALYPTVQIVQADKTVRNAVFGRNTGTGLRTFTYLTVVGMTTPAPLTAAGYSFEPANGSINP